MRVLGIIGVTFAGQGGRVAGSHATGLPTTGWTVPGSPLNYKAETQPIKIAKLDFIFRLI